MLTPTRTADAYTLQAQGESGWIVLCHYSEDRLDDAVRHCSRAVMIMKSVCRIIENAPQNVVCERFYNREDDREARDWDDIYEVYDDDLELSWKEDGF